MLELFWAKLSPAMFNVTLQLLKLYTWPGAEDGDAEDLAR